MNCSSYILKFALYPSVFIPYEFIFHEIHKLDEKTKWNFSCCQKTVWFSVLAPMGKCYFSPKSRLTSVFQFWNKGFKMYFYHAKVWRKKKKALENQNLYVEIWQACSDLLSWRSHVQLIWERKRHVISCQFPLSGSFPSFITCLCFKNLFILNFFIYSFIFQSVL